MSDSPYSSETQPQAATRRPLRIWPVVILLLVMIVCRLLPRLTGSESMPVLMASVMGPIAAGFFLLLWWLLASRATWKERFIGLLGIAVAGGLTYATMHESMRTVGLMMFTIPMGFGAFGLAAVLFGRSPGFQRTAMIVALTACGFGFSSLVRSDGMWGDYALDWHWRWNPTTESRLLEELESRGKTTAAVDAVFPDADSWLASPEWSEFRGPDRDSVQHGPVYSSDWSANPPERLWKRPIGPGWSSFVVAGKLLFTQEQRGEHESVVCYHADSGDEIWVQEIASRFYEELGGVGPRATPTLAEGQLFVQGASGQVQRLDSKTGEAVWTQDLRRLADRDPPTWGFSSSPLVVGPLVIAYAGGDDDKGTLAFDRDSGALKWSAPAGNHSYSSPQLATIRGSELVLMMTNAGLRLLDPADGTVRLNHEWTVEGYRAVQPAVVDNHAILISSGTGVGTRRIDVSEVDGVLSAEEIWTQKSLKPDFNDYVVHDGHAYGFDNAIMTCVELTTGKRKWKGGRYGKGQVLLLADSSLLLVAGEYGDVVLLNADPSGHQELASFKALEGRTWNHPVVVDDRLYIRNAQEAACYRLPVLDEKALADNRESR